MLKSDVNYYLMLIGAGGRLGSMILSELLTNKDNLKDKLGITKIFLVDKEERREKLNSIVNNYPNYLTLCISNLVYMSEYDWIQMFMDYGNKTGKFKIVINSYLVLDEGEEWKMETNLIPAMEKSMVQRYVPADFCVDHRHFHKGQLSKIDIRKKISEYLKVTDITFTSVLCGAIMERLFNIGVDKDYPHLIYYYGDEALAESHLIEATCIKDIASFLVYALINHFDEVRDCFLQIVGDRFTIRELQNLTSQLTNKEMDCVCLGSLKDLDRKIQVLNEENREDKLKERIGLQYMKSYLCNEGKLTKIDFKYADPTQYWTNLKGFISKVILPQSL
ncbi:hypothetical protein ABK040_004696 [Willaertia magna]